MPMTLAQAMTAEFKQEAANTRKMLERVPEGRFDWRPHEKSMSLGRLAGHIAESSSWVLEVVGSTELDFAQSDYKPFEPESSAELLTEFDKHAAGFEEAMAGKSDEEMLVEWTMKSGDHVIAQLPRVAAVRGFILSHTYHHRGQLSVYLRLLEVPVPGVYGPSADDSAGFSG
jgi:uncharacterized damage-inducible protein DinB